MNKSYNARYNPSSSNGSATKIRDRREIKSNAEKLTTHLVELATYFSSQS